jgi:3-oxoacyl-[acyl-carrier-protein] synthase-1
VVGPERLGLLAAPAFEEAIAPIHDMNVAVHIALDEEYDDVLGATDVMNSFVNRLLPGARVEVRPRGEAALGVWLPEATEALESRKVDAVVLGGVHSDFDLRAIAALEASGRLFSRDNLDARIPGEAAAFFVLMRNADAGRRNLVPLARVLGVGTGRERARHDNDESAYEALGLTAAVKKAMSSLAPTGQTAGWMFTDLTGEMRRMHEWQSAFTRAQNMLGEPFVIDSPAQRMGYLGAAAMPFFVVLASTAWEYGYAPSPITIMTAGNDGGERAALVLAKV